MVRSKVAEILKKDREEVIKELIVGCLEDNELYSLIKNEGIEKELDELSIPSIEIEIAVERVKTLIENARWKAGVELDAEEVALPVWCEDRRAIAAILHRQVEWELAMEIVLSVIPLPCRR